MPLRLFMRRRGPCAPFGLAICFPCWLPAAAAAAAAPASPASAAAASAGTAPRRRRPARQPAAPARHAARGLRRRWPASAFRPRAIGLPTRRRDRHQRHRGGGRRRRQPARRLLPRARHHPAGRPERAGDQLRGQPARSSGTSKTIHFGGGGFNGRLIDGTETDPLRPGRQARAAGARLRHLRRRLGPPVAAASPTAASPPTTRRWPTTAASRSRRRATWRRCWCARATARRRRSAYFLGTSTGGRDALAYIQRWPARLRRRDRQRAGAQLHRHAPVERGGGPRALRQRRRGLDQRGQDAAGAAAPCCRPATRSTARPTAS